MTAYGIRKEKNNQPGAHAMRRVERAWFMMQEALALSHQLGAAALLWLGSSVLQAAGRRP